MENIPYRTKPLFCLLIFLILCGFLPLGAQCANQADRQGAPWKTFSLSMDALQSELSGIASLPRSAESAALLVRKLLDTRDALLEADEAIQREFDRIEQQCLDFGFPDVILERHRNMRAHHDGSLRLLIAKLSLLELAAAEKRRETSRACWRK